MSRHERIPEGLAGQAVYLVVLGLAVVGFGWALTEGWRVGLCLVAVALAVGASARAALPTADVGLLAVRGRVVDTVMLAAVSALLVGIALSLG